MVGNTAFLGIPICEALFGPLGAVYAVLFDFGATVLTLSFGIWVLNGGRLDNWRPLVFNPLIWGVGAGLVWAAFGWSFPEWLAGAFDTVGGATLPMALLVAGAQVGNVHTQAWNLRRPLIAMLICRLLIVPLLMAGLVLVLRLQGQSAAVIILEAGMPVGLVTAIMARSYGADAEYASTAILWSNLAALATLPVLALLVG
jgi:predicted permease